MKPTVKVTPIVHDVFHLAYLVTGCTLFRSIMVDDVVGGSDFQEFRKMVCGSDMLWEWVYNHNLRELSYPDINWELK